MSAANHAERLIPEGRITNSNTIAVNGSAAQLTPYTEDATPGVLTFDLGAGSETVTIALDNTGSSFGRAFIFKIVITFVG